MQNEHFPNNQEAETGDDACTGQNNGASGDFKVQCGSRQNTCFLPLTKRLEQIRAGQNPYVSGNALRGNSPVFWGRDQILYEICAKLRRPDKPACVSVTGERRMGKSSLLNQIFQTLAVEENLITLYGDAQNWNQAGQEIFFSHLHQAVCAALSIDSPGNVQDYPAFRDFVAAHAARYRFVLIIDEFEAMSNNPSFDSGFFSNLRALGSDSQYSFAYLLSSRRPLQELCKQHDQIAASSFWNIFGIPHVLGLLQAKEAGLLIQLPLQRSLQGSSMKNQNSVLQWTGCHPAMIQMVMSSIWDSLQGGFKPDPARIKMGLLLYFKDLWHHRAPKEWEVLIKLAAGQKAVTNSALVDLQQRGLVTQNGLLFSPLFAEFIPEWLPPGKTLADAVTDISEGAERSHKFFESLLKVAGTVGKVRQAFLGQDETKQENTNDKDG